MATVTGLTAERMIEIEDASVVSGTIVTNDLILTTHGGSIINAGNVRGPVGPQGPAVTNLDSVGDVVSPSPTIGDLLTWNGSSWVNTPPASQIAVGTIQMFASSAPPPRFLLCNGSATPAGTAYDALRLLVGSNLPDLRNKFVIGAGGTTPLFGTGGADSVQLTSEQVPQHSHGAGSLYADAGGNHTHSVSSPGSKFQLEEAVVTNWTTGQVISSGGHGWLQPNTSESGNHTHDVEGATGVAGASGATQYHENRPPYVGLFYIIKY